MWRVKGIKQSTYRIRRRYNCQRRCAFVSFCSVCASAQSEWYFVFVKRCILLEFSLKNILQSFEMWTKRDRMWFFSLSVFLSLASCLFCFFLLFVFLVFVLPVSFVFFLVLDSLFLLSLSLHEGQKNLLLQATQVEWKLFCCLGLGVYYVR